MTKKNNTPKIYKLCFDTNYYYERGQGEFLYFNDKLLLIQWISKEFKNNTEYQGYSIDKCTCDSLIKWLNAEIEDCQTSFINEDKEELYFDIREIKINPKN